MTDKIAHNLEDVPAIAEYLASIGARGRSLRTAVVTESAGKYWRDVATIHFDTKAGTVRAPDGYEPTEDQAKAIQIECRQYRWPDLALTNSWQPVKDMPDRLREAETRNVYEFRDRKGNIIMKQVRHPEQVPPTGEPKYTTFTLWNDGLIRQMEPDGPLPLWGLDQLETHSVVFLHEGAKAAEAIADMATGKTAKHKDEFARHPWYRELSNAAHLGWIGGAQSPSRTDWKALKDAGVTQVFIVSDNDDEGRSAVPKIAKQLRCPTYSVEFTLEWPASFDLADAFPDKMFRVINNERHYVGPAFADCLHPATWATDLVTVGKGKTAKTVPVLRPHFARQWAYIEEVDVYVCVDLPDIIRPASGFNNMLRPFSDTPATAALLLKAYTGRAVKMSYKPDHKPGMVTADGTSSINVFRPTSIKSARGDPAPFLEYLKHLIPNDGDRKEVEKWCATLIARPDVRMEYGLLLLSETQGVGKNTLGAKILAPLVGMNNVGFPNESAIVDSQFNTWLARKRLVFVGEIYSGQSWKAYNRLKSYITDREVDVNEKHMRSYKIENWAHFCVCSNAILALKIEADDRRWLIPPLSEIRWSEAKFTAFYGWLESGGLSIIKTWAESYGDYVATGNRAPMTTRKARAIEDSLTDAERDLKDICEIAVSEDKAFAISSKVALDAARRNTRGTLYLTAHELGKAMIAGGWFKHGGKIKINGGLHILFLSPVARDQIVAIDDPGAASDRLRELETEGRSLVQKM